MACPGRQKGQTPHDPPICRPQRARTRSERWQRVRQLLVLAQDRQRVTRESAYLRVLAFCRLQLIETRCELVRTDHQVGIGAIERCAVEPLEPVDVLLL